MKSTAPSSPLRSISVVSASALASPVETETWNVSHTWWTTGWSIPAGSAQL